MSIPKKISGFFERGEELQVTYIDRRNEQVISPVAQCILTVIKESTKRPGSYITGWHICDQLGVGRGQLDCSIPGTKYDVALKELIDAGLVEELQDLGCRYRLCKNEE